MELNDETLEFIRVSRCRRAFRNRYRRLQQQRVRNGLYPICINRGERSGLGERIRGESAGINDGGQDSRVPSGTTPDGAGYAKRPPVFAVAALHLR
jgi:hypothetical protein